MPSTERFSAHTGICQILGSKSIRGSRHLLQVGDIVRFGSVGVLVAEINTGKTGHTDNALSSMELAKLINRVVSSEEENPRDFDSGVDTDEEAEGVSDAEIKDVSVMNKLSLTSDHGPNMCYVCYDESEEGNPLISPCKCSGDTKYIHVDCLKRWNRGEDRNEICTVIDEANLRACTICKSAYPVETKIPSGEVVSLLPDKLKPPCITFVVVTRHSSTNMAVNTKFQLSMSSLLDQDMNRPLLVGRSSQCDMVLKYRTVSTVHAEIHYNEGNFHVQDVGSSNGTLRFLYQPLHLRAGMAVHLKFGRTVVSLKAKKKISLSSLFSGFSASHPPAAPLVIREEPFFPSPAASSAENINTPASTINTPASTTNSPK